MVLPIVISIKMISAGVVIKQGHSKRMYDDFLKGNVTMVIFLKELYGDFLKGNVTMIIFLKEMYGD